MITVDQILHPNSRIRSFGLRNQIIYVVGWTMYESDAYDPTGGRTRAEWQAVNASGWTVDLPRGHYGSADILRIEDVELSPREFDVAFAAAQKALANL